jgi:hypothetical protein
MIAYILLVVGQDGQEDEEIYHQVMEWEEVGGQFLAEGAGEGPGSEAGSVEDDGAVGEPAAVLS